MGFNFLPIFKNWPKILCGDILSMRSYLICKSFLEGWNKIFFQDLATCKYYKISKKIILLKVKLQKGANPKSKTPQWDILML